jgi:tRNA (adenine57-N1/adenine58-N1)-methyltransferase
MDAEKKMGNEIIKEGDEVLLYLERDKFFIIEVKQNSSFSFHKGKIDHNSIIGKPYGCSVTTNKGYRLKVFRPTLADRILKLKRKTQIMYPKDIGVIILKSGVGNGSRVIEMGCGSGALTIALAHSVAPDGIVYSYDNREEFIELAKKNLEKAKLSKFVVFQKRDVKDGFDVEGVDAVFIDLPEPWEAVPHAARALKNSGIVVSLSPTFNQLERTAIAMEKNGFGFIESFEILMRTILPRENKTRPFERMVSHTGFIIMGRKTVD